MEHIHSCPKCNEQFGLDYNYRVGCGQNIMPLVFINIAEKQFFLFSFI